MPTLEARVHTTRATRYLVQLCRHANEMSRHRLMRIPAHVAGESHELPNQLTAEWSGAYGTISMDGGTCTLEATEGALLLRIEAEDQHRLRQLREMITRNLTRFSRREPVTLNWQAGEGSETPPATTGHTAVRHGHRRTVVLVVVGVLAVAAHVILGGAVLAAPQWTGLAADVILLIVVAKAALIGLGYLAHHRRKAAKTR